MILLLKNKKRVPGVLIAVIGATVIVGVFDLATHAGLSVLGTSPRACRLCRPLDRHRRHRADPRRRGRRRGRVVRRYQRAFPRLCRADGEKVDPNQEMVGLGAANLAAGFFQGFPISSSSSRTPVAEAAGARTQLTGVVGALAVALLILVAPDLLRHLPAPRWRRW